MRSASAIFFAVIGFLYTPAVKSDGRITLDTSTQPARFVGSDGRTHLFHGVNAVYKSFPWYPSTGAFDSNNSLSVDDMKNLRLWGFNVVRLGMMWPGVEPASGQYNQTYLQIMRRLVDDMYAHGIYTIVDFHQDAFSEKFCGEGVPSWLLDDLQPISHNCTGVVASVAKIFGQCKAFADFHYRTDPATGNPLTADCLSVTFDQYSRTPEVASSWGNFYKSELVQKKFQNFWKQVAIAMKGAPGVLGYDLLNEPLNGNFFEHPEVLEPGYSDQHRLQSVYATLYNVIRAEDADAIIMYEPPPFPDTFPSNIAIPGAPGVHAMGATSGPGGSDHAHQVLSYHIYSCGFADPACDRNGNTHALQCDICDKYASDAVNMRTSDVKKLGGGAFLTEFGACTETDKCFAEIDRMTSRAESAFTSWAYWQFKYFHDITTVSGPDEGFYTAEGALQSKKVARLSRTYAPIIAGKPNYTKFDASTGAFRLKYTTEPHTDKLPTEIFFNEDMNYKNSSFNVSVHGATYKKTAVNKLEVLADGSSSTVDFAMVKPYAGVTAGTFTSSDNDKVSFEVTEVTAQGAGFHLELDPSLTWRKTIVVRGDDGQILCQLSVHDNIKSSSCLLDGGKKHEMLFSYTIEIWKAKTLGSLRHIDTIQHTFFGPLLSKLIKFTWVKDSSEITAQQIDEIMV
eukprot:gnl/MRDRNA2_/MRDRNA2_163583_c0_seq1.p1 gnl/MRDRNA2_/MRDRNA2_163583_c0~~gnl/MRDRNA2_/MRDRNA2_163583_c0_seq1.p1  ORF type:complete len:680 (+),score=90.93 gnl/MRDRNA2_/MRDRNA2_163583_c0_seq1:90-2129(+)